MSPVAVSSRRTIVIASNRADAESACAQRGLKIEDVEWFTGPDKVGTHSMKGAHVFFAAAYTHRSDYAEAYAAMNSLRRN
jgi:hypothetical protein